MRRTSKIFCGLRRGFLVPSAGSAEGVELFEFFSVATVVPAVFNVAEEFDADFVGVEVARGMWTVPEWWSA